MKQKNILHKAGNLIAAIILLMFSIQKLIGVEEAVAGFKQLESLVPIDIDTFRMITGAVELFIALLLIAYTFNNKDSIGKIAYLMLSGTMLGALTMEFFARPEPMIMLVVIAIFLLVLSLYRLKTLVKK